MKNIYYTRAAILALVLIMTVLAVSCGRAGKGDAEDTTVPPSFENETEMGTYIDGEYLSPAESEKESEAETEKEKETEARLPKKTLKFVSYGNGTCAVAGIGSCTDSCVVIPERSPDGDVVTTIEDMAFYNNTDIKAIQIPSTVTSIGSRAFGGCSSLVYVSVDKANKTFCDLNGILYSADKTELILYPASCGATSIELSATLKRIADMAFYDCGDLKIIYFAGSMSDWGKIDIGEMNYGLYTASISCADMGK